ncbi:hypothetical protein RBE51_18205 [Pseudomonas taiwanensis]|uniref:hypothetical protein n=1 Tax=Pseudomonas taiwanensis TaxID=470150 RepID=UPI0028DF24EC|nr:hypothetical protein [Pseudomonas taiwanensis]MDT8924729.1 hypothetical protein [Pseudomonas taiwanensis]
MNSKDLNRLVRNPVAMMKFQATGKFERPETPSSPLITLLMSLHPRERVRILDVQMHPDLGYRSGLSFVTAGLALNWLFPANPPASIPSESHKDQRFKTELTIRDLAKHAKVPQDIIESWERRQQRPARPQEPQDDGLGI